MDTIELAARCAVVTWFDSEGPLSEEVRATPFFEESLVRRWLIYWMVARTVSRQNRAQLCGFLDEARRRLFDKESVGRAAYSLVEDIAEDGGKLPIFKGRPISLVSKFAFSCWPELFCPTDNRARRGIKGLGYRVHAQNYAGYMLAFEEEKKIFIQKTRQAGVVVEALMYRGRIMPASLFERRTFDKYLMLLGGFSEQRVSNLLRASRFLQ